MVIDDESSQIHTSMCSSISAIVMYKQFGKLKNKRVTLAQYKLQVCDIKSASVVYTDKVERWQTNIHNKQTSSYPLINTNNSVIRWINMFDVLHALNKTGNPGKWQTKYGTHTYCGTC